MDSLIILFVASLLIIFYTYLGYGMILGVLSGLKKSPMPVDALSHEDLPEVAMVISAQNSDSRDILRKVNNCLSLDYPDDRLHLYFIANVSPDLASEVTALHPNVQFFASQDQEEKAAAIDRLMKQVAEPITVFAEAQSVMNKGAVKSMIAHFQNNLVGVVAGEKTITKIHQSSIASAQTGIFRKYERLLKIWDYRLHSLAGALSEPIAIRTFLYEPREADTIMDDFVMSLKIAKKGYRVAYEPAARTTETAATDLMEEMRHRVRISAGGLQAIWKLRSLLNPFKYGLLSFQFISHRVMRWTLAPLSLMVAFLTNLLLAKIYGELFLVLFLFQAAFYLISVIGFHYEKELARVKGFIYPLYFTFMNLSVYLGLLKLIARRNSEHSMSSH